MVSFSGAISVEDDSHPYTHTEAKYIYTGIMQVLFHLNYNGSSSLLHSHMGLIKFHMACGAFYSYSKAEDHICNVVKNARLDWQCLSDAGPFSPVILDPSTVQLLASPHINFKVKKYGMGDLKLMRHFLVFNIIDEHATRHCFSFAGAQVHGWFHTENNEIVVMKTSQIPFLPWRCQCLVEPKYKYFGVEQKFICNDWNWHTGANVYRHPPLSLCPRMMLKES